MLTPERIAEIQARLDAATPGPWHVCLGSGVHLMTAIAADLPNNKTLLIADFLTDYMLKYPENRPPYDHRPNMDLCENAPTDIRDLLTELHEWESRAVSMFPFLKDDAKCGDIRAVKEAYQAWKSETTNA